MIGEINDDGDDVRVCVFVCAGGVCAFLSIHLVTLLLNNPHTGQSVCGVGDGAD
jgi:hypothetical protein